MGNPLSYPQVLDEYTRSKAFGDPRDMPTFAKDMNQRTGSQDYNEGLRDSWWTRASTRIDQSMDWRRDDEGPISDALQNHSIVQDILSSAPRMAAESVPMIATGGMGALAGLGIAATAGLGAAHTYAETGSKTQAAIMGAAGLAMPGLGHVLGGVGEAAAGPLGRFAASQASMIGVGQAAQAASNLVAGQKYDPSDPHFWLQQVPFTIFDAVHALTAPKAGQEGIVPPTPTTPETKPNTTEFTPAKGSTVGQAQMEQLLGRWQETMADPNATPEAKSQGLMSAIDQIGKGLEEQSSSVKVPTDKNVGLSGIASRASNGVWKMLVQGQSGDKITLPEHNNVWINSIRSPVLDERTGQYSWSGKHSELNSNVKSPIVGEDQSVLAQNPQLPVQQEGVEPTKPGVAVSPEVGVTPSSVLSPDQLRHAQAMVPEVTPEQLAQVNSELAKEAITQHEQAVGVEEQARSAGVTPLDKAENIPSVTEANPVETVKQELANGSTPAQAAEVSRLKEQTPKVDEAMTVQQAALQSLLENISKPESLTPDQEAQWNRTANQGPNAVEADFKGMPSLPWGAAHPELPKYFSRVEAQIGLEEWQREHPEDNTDWEIKNRGVGETKSGKYVISQRYGKSTTAPGEVGGKLTVEEEEAQREQAHVEKGHSLTQAAEPVKPELEASNEDRIEPAPDPVHERPDASIQTVIRQLEVAQQSPQAFASAAEIHPNEVFDVTERGKVVIPAMAKGGGLSAVNSALDEARLTTFKTQNELQKFLKKVSMGIDEYRQMSNFTLGSTTLHDPALVKLMGFENGPRHVLNWLLAQDSDGVTGATRSLIESMLKALPEGSDPTMTYPGHPDWKGDKGSSYYKRNINIGSLPQRDDQAIPTALVVAHEMAHHATRELANEDTPEAGQFRTTLEQVRKAALQNASKGIRTIVTRSMQDGLLRQYQQDDISYSDMQKKWAGYAGKGGEALVRDQHDIIYGLHSRDELLAQAFSSPQMVEHLRGTQVDTVTKQSLLQKFTGAWQKLFGAKAESSSALAQLMQGMDNYLGSKQTYNGRTYLRDMLVNQVGVRPEALASRLQTLEGLYNTGKLEPSLQGYQREQQGGLLPVSNTQEGDVHPSLEADLTTGQPKDVAASTMALNLEQIPYHQDLLHRLKQDVSLVQGLRQQIEQGKVPGELPPVQDNLRLASANVNAMSDAMRKQTLAMQRFMTLHAFTDEGFNQAQVGALVGKHMAPAADPTGNEDEARDLMGFPNTGRNSAQLQGKGVGWLTKTFMPLVFVKDTVPAVRDSVDHGIETQTRSRSRLYSLGQAKGYDPQTDQYSGKRADNFNSVMTSPTLEPVASNAFRVINKLEQAGEKWSLKDGPIGAILSKVSQSARDSITKAINNMQQMYMVHVNENVATHLDISNRQLTTRAIQSVEGGILPKDAMNLSAQLHDSLAMLKDPQQAPIGASQLQALSTKMSADGFVKTIQLAQGLQAAADKHLAFLNSRPGFVTEQRYGDHQIVATQPDNQPYRASFKSRQTALADQQRIQKLGYTNIDYLPDENQTPTSGIAPGMLDAIKELDNQNASLMQQFAGSNPELVAQMLPYTQRAAQYQASLASVSPIPGGATPKRKFVSGRESINMMENGNAFFGKSTNYMRIKELQQQADIDRMHPDIQQNSEIDKMVTDNVTQQASPDSPIARKLNEFAFYKNLAFNAGVSMMHGVQSLTRGMAALIDKANSPGDAFSLTGQANKNIINFALGKKLDANTQFAFDQLRKEGRLNTLTNDPFVDPDLASFQNSMRQGPLGKGVNVVRGLTRGLSNSIARYNDMVGQIAGYQHGLNMGLSQKDAFELGREVSQQGYDTAGKAGRSGLWSAFGPQAKAIPQLLTSMQTYQTGFFGQLASTYKRGFGEAPEGLTSYQRDAAKKSFLYMLAAQATLAGALGLPGVGQGLALVKQITGVDTKDWVKKNLANLFGEDETNGGMLTTLALHGAVAPFTPIDPSGRHIPSVPFLGVSSRNGFQLENLIPAPFTSAYDVFKGLCAAAQGKPEQAVGALPHVFQGPLELLAGGGSSIKDKYGTYQLTPGERFVQALGLSSSRVTEEQDAAKTMSDMAQVQEQQKRNLAGGIVDLVKSGDSQGAQQKLLEIQQANPGLDMHALVQAVVQQVVGQAAPAHQWNTDSQQVPYFDARRSAVQNASMSLGLPPSRPNLRAELQAQSSDRLMTANPYWTPQQDQQQARAMLPTGRPSIGLWPQASRLPYQTTAQPW